MWEELKRARNIRPSFRWGLIGGLAYSALDTYVLRGRAPWTFHHGPDHETLRAAARCRPIDYSKPDGEVTFDKPSSVYLSNTNHEENQPCHLTLKDASVPVAVNLARYDGPEERFCPAGVLRILRPRRGPAPAHQRPELRPLQDLRHQGPDPEHPLGGPRRRRRPQLSEHVSPGDYAGHW